MSVVASTNWPQSGPAPIATEALQRIAELYRIESEIRGRSPEERRTAPPGEKPTDHRCLRAMAARKARAGQPEEQARRSHPLHTRALGRGSAASSMTAASRSTPTSSNGRIRPIALNRKNALFAGSDGGGEHWATIASLIETAKLNGVDPYAYLADVITRIDGHPQSQIDDLLPWAYAPAPLKAVA
jgi:transposase